MRSLLSSALLATLVLAVVPSLPQVAHAGAGVLRCQKPDGSTVYTNKACSAFGATSAPIPGDVLHRIEREIRREAALSGIAPSGSATNGSRAFAKAERASIGSPLNRGCAGSPQQLEVNLQGALAFGDVNRIAETYHWNGMRTREARRIMSRLEQLASRQVVSVEYFDATIGSLGSGLADASASAPDDGEAGMLRALINAGSGTQVVDFSVHRAEGCYLARF